MFPSVKADGLIGVFRNSCGRTSHEDRRVEIEAAENAEQGVAADGVPQQDAAEEWTTTFAAARFTGPDYCTLPAALRHAHRRQESREIVPRGLDGVLRVRGGPPPHVPAPSGLRRSSRVPSAAQHPVERALRADPLPVLDGDKTRISKSVVYLRHEDRTSHHRHPAPDHLHRRRPLRPRAAAGDQEPGPPRTAPARRRHRPLGRDRGARPVSAARLLQPVRLRGARARLTATRPLLDVSAPCGCAPINRTRGRGCATAR